MSSGYILGTCYSFWVHWRYMANNGVICWVHQNSIPGYGWAYHRNILELFLTTFWMLFGRYMLGTCWDHSLNVPKMWLVDTLGEKWSRAHNLPKMFPLVSRSPHPQCDWLVLALKMMAHGTSLIHQLKEELLMMVRILTLRETSTTSMCSCLVCTSSGLAFCTPMWSLSCSWIVRG